MLKRKLQASANVSGISFAPEKAFLIKYTCDAHRARAPTLVAQEATATESESEHKK
jgi:hypothetical protein